MVEVKSNFNGFTLTKAAIHTSGLTTLEKLVLIIIADHADNLGMAWPSIETITELAGLSSRSGKQRKKIIDTIKSLEAKGLVKKTGYHGHSRQYHLNLRVHPEGTLKSTPRGVHEHTTQHTSNSKSQSITASKQPDPTPTAEPSVRVAKVTQQSLRSFADEPQAALVTSATAFQPPSFGSSRSYRRPYSNQYIYEGADFRRSFDDVVVAEEAL